METQSCWFISASTFLALFAAPPHQGRPLRCCWWSPAATIPSPGQPGRPGRAPWVADDPTGRSVSHCGAGSRGQSLERQALQAPASISRVPRAIVCAAQLAAEMRTCYVASVAGPGNCWLDAQVILSFRMATVRRQHVLVCIDLRTVECILT